MFTLEEAAEEQRQESGGEAREDELEDLDGRHFFGMVTPWSSVIIASSDLSVPRLEILYELGL